MAADLGYTTITMWSGDVGDSRPENETSLVANAGKSFQPQQIVLIHANLPTVTHCYPQLIDMYVAMTRGRESNNAYLYERIAGEGEHERNQPNGLHVMRRGTNRDAAVLLRGIIANHDEQVHTAHAVAAATEHEQLPDRVASLLDRRAHAVQARRTAYRRWDEETQDLLAERERWIEQHLSRDRGQEQGLDYGLDL